MYCLMVFCSYSSPYLIKYETMKIDFFDFNLVYNRIDCLLRFCISCLQAFYQFFSEGLFIF